MNFKLFAQAVKDRFDYLQSNHNILRTNADLTTIKEVYLNSFPEGTNPIYLTNTEHDCSCCKNFIRNVGPLIAVDNGKKLTVWDVEVPEPYQTVANKMREYITSLPITGVFYASEKKYGAYKTTQLLPNGTTIDWNHFNCEIKPHLFKGDKVGELSSKDTTSASVLKTSLEKFTLEAVNTVIELIEDNSLYRGEEHLNSVKQFKTLLSDFSNYSESVNLFAYENFKNPAARFKNTVIGTLVEDISKGVELETAVKSFELKVAPTNYKRSKSLITKNMINSAMKTIQELDLEQSLERRHAVLNDMDINDILWSDHSVQSQMKNGIEDLLQSHIKPSKSRSDSAQEISIGNFIKEILPSAQSIETYIDNKHQSNFMNIIASVNESKQLFKWNNNFTWSYNGNVTDSMKETVKSFGGKVDGKLRCSIMWNGDNDNPDDLDLHCMSPYGHIYYSDKGNHIFNLDIDITNPANKVAVENIVHSHSEMREGIYKFYVNNFSHRGATSGFKAEIEFDGQVYEYSHPKPVNQDVPIATITVDIFGTLTIEHHMEHSAVSKEIYNLHTNQYAKVTNIMLSPNHWGENKVGNKHYMFILDGAKTKNSTRGFYNEFLSNELNEHRKVFEILASKTKVEPSDQQIAGLGFSSTISNDLLVRVDNRPYKIIF